MSEIEMSDDYYRFPGDKYRGRELGLPNEFSPALPFVHSRSVSLFFPSVGSTHPS